MLHLCCIDLLSLLDRVEQPERMNRRDYVGPLRILDLRSILDGEPRFRRARWTIHYWGPSGMAVGTELERFVIEREGSVCRVYYSERGLASEPEFAGSEDKACHHFLACVYQSLPCDRYAPGRKRPDGGISCRQCGYPASSHAV